LPMSRSPHNRERARKIRGGNGGELDDVANHRARRTLTNRGQKVGHHAFGPGGHDFHFSAVKIPHPPGDVEPVRPLAYVPAEADTLHSTYNLYVNDGHSESGLGTFSDQRCEYGHEQSRVTAASCPAGRREDNLAAPHAVRHCIQSVRRIHAA
jgi:hypothetical protein